MSNAIKKKVNDFIKQHKLKDINYVALKDAATSMGYTVIEFNIVANDKDVEMVIQNLNLGDMIVRSRGFIYANNNYRLIFINEDLNEEEKVLVICHEIGHIVCGHFSVAPIIGIEVKEEHEANEFCHYLLNPGLFQKLKKCITIHRKAFIIAVSVLCISICLITTYLTMQNKNKYTDNLYVTSAGERYHKKDCIFVKNKTNVKKMTKKEFDKGIYVPCDMCLPDKD